MNSRRLLLTACAFGVGVAMAADYPMPHQKPGLWEITMTMANQPMNEKICLDQSTEDALYKMSLGISKKNCTRNDIHSAGNQLISDRECTFGTRKVTGHSVMTFAGDTAYHVDSTSHYDPPLGNRGDTKTAMDAKWVSACPSDMKPGDVIVSGGRIPNPMRMNLNDMLDKQ